MSNMHEDEVCRYDDLCSRLIQNRPKLPVVPYGDSVSLFEEGLRCYKFGSYVATAVMCRAAIEAMLYIAKSRKRIESGFAITASRPSLACLIAWASSEGLLDEKGKAYAEYVKEMGDFSAHLAERTDRQVKPTEPIKLWISDKEAPEILERTLDLLFIVAERHKV